MKKYKKASSYNIRPILKVNNAIKPIYYEGMRILQFQNH